MSNIQGGYTLRDFRKGRVTESAVSTSLIPENSVAETQNLNYDTRIGAAVVRPGTTKLGNTIANGKTPLGLTTYSTQDLSTNLVVGVYSGTTNASIYFYNGSWNTSTTYSGSATLSNTAKNRFANLGGRIFRTNGVNQLESSSNGSVWNTTWCTGITGLRTAHTVGLIFRQKNRLLAAADTTYPSRVWFSSIISPANISSAITWNGANTTGDFIDINPDDGDFITAFAETSTLTLIFKSNAIYRLNVISKTVDTENIFNVGAVSQEAVTSCQGVVYFFSGKDIRRTSGGFPEQISRIGIQDFIDAIPQSSWANVVAGNDDWNVYFSIGNITLYNKQNAQVTFKNVTLKFSTRDESWSVHSYGDQYRFFSKYTTSAGGKTLIGSETSGNVQTLNSGLTDNGRPIFYFLETQGLEFGTLQDVKEISNKIVFFTNNGENSRIQIGADSKTLKKVPVDLTGQVNVGRNVNVRGNYINIRWDGESNGTAPEFEGFHIAEINNSGIN